MSRGAPKTIIGNYTILKSDNWVICNNASTITITLPSGTDNIGRELMFKNIGIGAVNSYSYIIPLTGGTATTTQILSGTAGQWATLVYDGLNWNIMQGSV